jgi:hypothetical protein
MNQRQIMTDALLFKKVTPYPFGRRGPRVTRKRWYSEGLPQTIAPGDIPEYAYRQAGARCLGLKAGRGFL